MTPAFKENYVYTSSDGWTFMWTDVSTQMYSLDYSYFQIEGVIAMSPKGSIVPAAAYLIDGWREATQAEMWRYRSAVHEFYSEEPVRI